MFIEDTVFIRLQIQGVFVEYSHTLEKLCEADQEGALVRQDCYSNLLELKGIYIIHHPMQLEKACAFKASITG